MNANELIENITPDFLVAFPKLPAYGCIAMKIHLHDSKPVRIEWTGSKTIRVKQEERNSNHG